MRFCKEMESDKTHDEICNEVESDKTNDDETCEEKIPDIDSDDNKAKDNIHKKKIQSLKFHPCLKNSFYHSLFVFAFLLLMRFLYSLIK